MRLLDYWGFQLGVVKAKPKKLLNTKDTDNTVSQSKLEVITCSWLEEREMWAYESRLVLVLLLTGWKIGASFLSQSFSAVNARAITFRHSNENCSIFTMIPVRHYTHYDWSHPSSCAKNQLVHAQQVICAFSNQTFNGNMLKRANVSVNQTVWYPT